MVRRSWNSAVYHLYFNFTGKEGGKLRDVNGIVFQSLSSYYRDQVEVDNATAKAGSASLKYYSPWLASFNGSEHTEKIEIPGQYSNCTSPPVPSEHSTIRFFHPTSLIMSSMRRPKRITLIGSLGVESMWLAKSGEDLRMDQRIQQLFQVFNGMFETDPYCIKYETRVETYEVIPMSGNAGIIQWVYNTIPLSGCYKSDPAFEKEHLSAKRAFEKTIMKRKGKGFIDCIY
jgi:DNA-dependent protein kinase catalytic subunit